MSQNSTKEKNYHTDNKSFMLYKDWERYFNMLSDSEIAMLVKGLFAFASRGEKLKLEGMSAMAYEFMINSIERDGDKWEKKCQKNTQNGKKGGRPKANGFSENPTQPRKADKDKDKDKDKEKDIDTDTDKEKETDKETDTEKEKMRYYGKYRNVALTDSQYKSLVMSSSSSKTDKYIEKLSKWLNRKEKSCDNCFEVISHWISEDTKSASDISSSCAENTSESKPSYDLDEFEQYAMNFSLSKKNNWE